MKLYERLGLNLANLGLENRLEALEMTKKPPRAESVARSQKDRLVVDNTLVALAHYLLEDKNSAATYAAQVVPAARENFFGDWRRTFRTDDGAPDPLFWKRHSRWMDFFSFALGWGAAMGDWEGVGAVAEYPDDDVADEGEPARKSLYRAFASHLLKQPGAQTLKLLSGTQHKKSSALAAEALKGLVARDARVFEKALAELLKHHKKLRLPSDDLTEKQSFDATFLVHLAERDGLKFEVPEPYRDLVIRLR